MMTHEELPISQRTDGARPFGALDILAVVTMNVLMGTNMVAMKFAINALGPFTTSVTRFGIIFLTCLPWLGRERARWRLLALLGLFNGCLMSVMMNLALEYSANIGALAIVAQLCVPFSVILGVLFLRESVTNRRLLGTIIAFGGVAIMLFDRRVASDLLGIALMTGGALSWAFSSLLQRRLAGVPILTFYAWTGLVTFVLLLPVAALLEPNMIVRLEHLEWRPAAWLLYSTLAVTLIGQGCLAWLLRHHPVSVVMPLSLVTPVVAVAAASVFFGNLVTLSMIAGGSLVLAGIVLATRTANVVPAPAAEAVELPL